MSIAPVRHRLSVDDYVRIIEFGILTEKNRAELINGEILEKKSIGELRAACVKRLNQLLGLRAGQLACIGVQDPIRLADSEPEPDITLLKPRDDFYATGHPGPG